VAVPDTGPDPFEGLSAYAIGLDPEGSVVVGGVAALGLTVVKVLKDTPTAGSSGGLFKAEGASPPADCP